MKRIVILLLISALLTLSSTSTIAYGAESNSFKAQVDALMATIDLSEEVSNALSGRTDVAVSDVINVEAGVFKHDTSLPISMSTDISDEFDVKYTIKEVGDIVSEDGSIDTLYAIIAAAVSIKETNKTEDNVYCILVMGYIRRIFNHEIVSVVGQWIPNGRTLSNRTVAYGAVDINGDFIYGSSEMKSPTSDLFYYDSMPPYTGIWLRACSWVDSSGYPNTIFLSVMVVFL